MERLHYLDFDLKLERNDDQYTARILQSPAGEAANVFTLPFSDDRLENLILKIGGHPSTIRGSHSVEMTAARELGGRLFDAVFAGDVRACFKNSLDIVNSMKETGLRLKLRLQDVPELAEIPWEFLFDASLSRFIAQSNQTPIIRYIEMPERDKPLKMDLPLRVLVITSSPFDYCTLGVESERSSLEKALKPLSDSGQLSVRWLEKPTLSDLQHCLQEGDYNVFHFIGHGGFDEKTQEGVLLLEDGQGKGCFAGADIIGTFLHDLRSLRLAVLNSCEGARNSRTDPFAGVAAGLIRQGIPAVVAMQFAITDNAAITFSGEFYSTISRGFPVDAAVAEARKAIYATNNEIEWGTPVLYMRSPDGVLFDIKGIQPVDVPRVPIKETSKSESGPRDIIILPPGSSLDELNICAQQLYNEGKYSEALDKWNEVLELDPENKKALEGIDKLRREREEKEQKFVEILTGGIQKQDYDAKKIAEKQPQATASGSPTGILERIGNASMPAKIAGIFAIAIVAILLFGLPMSEQEPIIPVQQPSLSVSPDPISFDLGNMSTGETTVKTVLISNTGQGTLDWNVSADQAWMTVNPENGTGSETVNIIINTTGLQSGRYSGIISVDSNAGTRYGKISLDVINTPNVNIKTTQNAPILKLSQNSLKLESIDAGESTKKVLKISNDGGGTLEWKLSADKAWIDLYPLSGSNNGSVIVTIDTSDLGPGNYNGNIMVTSNGGNEGVTIKLNIPSPTPTPTITPTHTITPVLASITVSPATVSVVVGDSQNFITNPRDQFDNPITAIVEWTSSNTSVGTIDGNGVFTAKAAGQIVITATSGVISGTATVNVTQPQTINMEFVQIPAGEFDMGSPSTDVNSGDSERPVHHVKFANPFYLGKYEVTQKQWRDVMGTNPSYFTGDDLPVEQISWDDVQQFITKLNAKEGTTKYRLPSEAEWEYAARAGTTTIYSFGDDTSKLGDYAWYSISKTSNVGQKKPNPWGLYDMHGNVWELVQDNWHADYNGAPTDGSSWVGGSGRLARGGGFWAANARLCRSAVRNYYDPGYRDFNLGFRLLRDL